MEEGPAGGGQRESRSRDLLSPGGASAPPVCNPSYLTEGYKKTENRQQRIGKSRIFGPSRKNRQVSTEPQKLTPKGGNHVEETIEALKTRRLSCGVSQEKLASAAGITRQYLNRLEMGNADLSPELSEKLLAGLARFDPERPLTLLFDYVRIRFPTLDVRHVVEDVLRLKLSHLLHEDFGFYSYTEHYHLGDVFVLTSNEEKKGVLLELKGRGCRQFESYLLAQGRNWYELFLDALMGNAVFKRVDLAINDRMGILDIPFLAAKCEKEECISVFRSFRSYKSGEVVRDHPQEKLGMGNTLYLGSMKSDVYFCVYEKDYEQYVKNHIPLADAEVKNRFEIQLKNDRALHALQDLLLYDDPEKPLSGSSTAMSASWTGTKKNPGRTGRRINSGNGLSGRTGRA